MIPAVNNVHREWLREEEKDLVQRFSPAADYDTIGFFIAKFAVDSKNGQFEVPSTCSTMENWTSSEHWSYYFSTSPFTTEASCQDKMRDMLPKIFNVIHAIFCRCLPPTEQEMVGLTRWNLSGVRQPRTTNGKPLICSSWMLKNAGFTFVLESLCKHEPGDGEEKDMVWQIASIFRSPEQ